MALALLDWLATTCIRDTCSAAPAPGRIRQHRAVDEAAGTGSACHSPEVPGPRAAAAPFHKDAAAGGGRQELVAVASWAVHHKGWILVDASVAKGVHWAKMSSLSAASFDWRKIGTKALQHSYGQAIEASKGRWAAVELVQTAAGTTPPAVALPDRCSRIARTVASAGGSEVGSPARTPQSDRWCALSPPPASPRSRPDAPSAASLRRPEPRGAGSPPRLGVGPPPDPATAASPAHPPKLPRPVGGDVATLWSESEAVVATVVGSPSLLRVPSAEPSRPPPASAAHPSAPRRPFGLDPRPSSSKEWENHEEGRDGTQGPATTREYRQ